MEFYGLEGDLQFVTVSLSRDLRVYSGLLVLEYATSDLTARGVDRAKFAECFLLAATERGPAGCGDYEQTTGQLRIPAGEEKGGFTIRISDDRCWEIPEYLQVSVSVPGGGALQGEKLSAKIRIDDNDYDHKEQAVFC